MPEGGDRQRWIGGQHESGAQPSARGAKTRWKLCCYGPPSSGLKKQMSAASSSFAVWLVPIEAPSPVASPGDRSGDHMWRGALARCRQDAGATLYFPTVSGAATLPM